MRLKTILLTTVATGALMCEPVMAYAVDSTPDSMGWFRKKKKSEPNDSVKSKNEYEKLTGDGSIIHRGMFNVYQKKNDYYWGSRNLVGIIVSYSHPKFRPLPHGNKSIGGVGSHRASL